jgi:hypothetical protein
MAFTSFSTSAGHKEISREIVAELQALAARHGLRFSTEGGTLGTNDLLIKLRVRAADRSAVDADAKRKFAMEARYMGLEESDYGVIFSTYNGRYKLTGIKPSAPKYPFLGECQRTGKTFKLPRSIIPSIIAARPQQQTTSSAPAGSAPAPSQTDDRYAGVAQF